MANIHCFQHVAYEGLGTIAAWANAAGHRVRTTRLFDGEPVRPVDDADLLVVMGGPMNVHEEDRHPWLTHEKRAIERAIAGGKRVLGVCLGAQLVADALGARVYRNAVREIGWYPVETTAQARSTRLFAGFPARLCAFHWHGDTFDIPAGALHVARSAGCEHQAFVYGEGVVGLQFHLETTRDDVQGLIENGADELNDELNGGPYVQAPAAMLEDPGRFDLIASTMRELLERLTSGMPARPGEPR